VRVVANADDPLVAWAAEKSSTTWVGAGQPWQLDAASCPACGGLVTFGADGWSCDSCGRTRPRYAVTVEADDVVMTGGQRQHLDLSLPGRANRANAAMALAAATAMDVDPAAAVAAWREITTVQGRYGRVDVDGKSVRLLLAKNPAGWLEVLELLAESEASLVLALNARTQDGVDPSWIWDVPFERLAGRRIVCAGERAADLAVRLAYADLEYTLEPDLRAALQVAPGERVDLAGNYSAFQDARKVVRRG
jgi:UDP-N-acetylmuramyl tripeptide synthase